MSAAAPVESESDKERTGEWAAVYALRTHVLSRGTYAATIFLVCHRRHARIRHLFTCEIGYMICELESHGVTLTALWDAAVESGRRRRSQGAKLNSDPCIRRKNSCVRNCLRAAPFAVLPRIAQLCYLCFTSTLSVSSWRWTVAWQRRHPSWPQWKYAVRFQI